LYKVGQDEKDLHIILRYRRKHHFYKTNYITILQVITFLVVVGWTIDPKTSGERLNMDVTLLLVAVAFKHATTSMLPPISYMTEMDR